MKPAELLKTVFSTALIAYATSVSTMMAADLKGAQLLTALQTGGYSIYFRHSITNPNAVENFDVTYSKACLEDGECGPCEEQRTLIDEGRDQARKIGAYIQELKIPIGQVLASPLCRTMETGTLIFGRAEPSVDVRDGGFGPTSHPRLKKILSAAIPSGANQGISGHSGQFQIVAGDAYHLEEGEAAIIKGFGNGNFKIVARIRDQDWAALKEAADAQ